ncbi:crotonase/enoyl-CoA hydratase family protein [Flexivirga caeni]|uniref:Crotonase/enoyl-CoA hydratase family protein n=1 Tax=Flexivirga caeni TaxID=2294115 RepID=A0A3M9M400_9MICO|nr:crotonase/enoyl-CoA hydratase family protein [Flexivirga caeni]RNI19885.1 crotonase/enoyl-CoA hydratase family protein [Flexivirga caeni]
MSNNIEVTVADGIADVRLDRPEKLNGLTLPMLRELASVARKLRSDKEIRTVILSGNGTSFCAGLDFKTVTADPKQLPLGLLPRPWRSTNLFQEACWAWRRVPVPVVAAVHGHCYGGGLQIALSADLRVTAPDAKWSVLEGKWGLIPDMTGVQALSELVGIETAKRLTMTAEIISGTEAAQIGLVGQVDPQPYGAARALAASLAQRSPDALVAAKRLFDRTWTMSARRTFTRERWEQARLLLGANFTIARKAGLQREQPVFQSRR